jgi:hypothetical protein
VEEDGREEKMYREENVEVDNGPGIGEKLS